jgi:hypothetical protein
VESEWWKGRTREGREGWFPNEWVEVLERREPQKRTKRFEYLYCFPYLIAFDRLCVIFQIYKPEVYINPILLENFAV